MLKYFILLALPLTTLGQGQGQGVQTHLDIRPFMSLQVTVVGQNLDYKFDEPQDFRNGILKNDVFNVKIKSNRNWQLTISSLTSNFQDYLNGQSTSLPSNALSLRKGSSNTFLPITVNQTTIATGRRGGTGNPNNNFNLDLLANVPQSQKSGRYALDVIFTLTAD